jgi:hypothetical protein
MTEQQKLMKEKCLVISFDFTKSEYPEILSRRHPGNGCRDDFTKSEYPEIPVFDSRHIGEN